MAKTKISEFSSTPGNNTDIDSINLAEGCAPSGINDAIRELMAQLKDFQTGAAGDSFNGPVGTTTAAAVSATTLTTSGAVTHNGGTANGVAYLNGSKVLTTGSALVFDGTNLGIGTSSPGAKLQVQSGTLTNPTWAASDVVIAGNSTGNAAFYQTLSDVSGGLVFSTPTTRARSFLIWNETNGNMSLTNGSSGAMIFTNNGAERARIDLSGNVLIGDTSAAGLGLTLGDGKDLWFKATGYNTWKQVNYQGGLYWNNGSDRVVIDASGNLLVGTTSTVVSSKLYVAERVAFKGIASHAGENGVFSGVNFNFQWNGSAARLWIDGTDLGSISVSSDYRIKKNVETQTEPAIARIAQLRPVTYEIADYGSLYQADGVVREGFIAHEVQAVIPSGAEGEKDEEGRIQNLRLDAILAVAVKAIQEQQAIITALTARVAALESN